MRGDAASSFFRHSGLAAMEWNDELHVFAACSTARMSGDSGLYATSFEKLRAQERLWSRRSFRRYHAVDQIKSEKGRPTVLIAPTLSSPCTWRLHLLR